MTTFIRYSCPICDWFHQEARSEVDDGALAQVFGAGVMARVVANQQLERIENTLAAHFNTHTTVEWIGAVRRLREENDELRTRLTAVES